MQILRRARGPATEEENDEELVELVSGCAQDRERGAKRSDNLLPTMMKTSVLSLPNAEGPTESSRDTVVVTEDLLN